MATYKEIKGTDITVVSSDPSNPVTGEVWYNTTTQKLKGYQQVLGNAWSTGGNLNTARQFLGGAGSQTATLVFGGNKNPGTDTAETEAYNGSAWTEVADLNTARQNLGSAGTSTAALAAGGGPPAIANTETWNGSNWTSITAVPGGGFGTVVIGLK